MAGDDLLMAGPDVMPGALAGWLRCRPTGAVLNLIRKELRLLRPVWLISLLAAVGWACLTLFGLLYERGFSRNFETAVVIVGVVSTLMIAILAGSLSLGEERTSGTHAWHLTLPVSALLQWLIKLSVALFAGIVGAGLLPMLIAGRLFGSSRVFVDVHSGIGWLLVVLTPDLCRILVRVHPQLDGGRGVVGFSGGRRRFPDRDFRRLGCAKTRGSHSLHVRSPGTSHIRCRYLQILLVLDAQRL